VGKSQGKPWPAYTKQDLASDLRAALRCLRNQAGIDPNRVGIVGHSEGGTLATVVAANSRDVAFLVILGTPGLPGGDVLCDQISHLAPTFGVRESTTSDYVRLMNQAYNILQQSVIPSGVRRNLETVFETYDARTSKRDKESLRKSGYNVPDNSKDFAASILLPWMKDFLIYDPRPALEQVRCPVLSLIGEKDLQVLAIENSSAIRGALLAGRNQDYTVSILEGLNHLLQTARTGSPAEYELIDETIAPLALTTVTAWILKRTR
jgi:pimeloyl-ACP methyl ester carboxylesterase